LLIELKKTEKELRREMATLVTPHGGVLIDRVLPNDQASALRARAASLPRVTLDAREVADVELIAIGAASPLTGFLGSADYQRVLADLRLADGTVWPLPFTLAVEDPQFKVGDEVALFDEAGRLWGSIEVSEIFERDPLVEAQAVYRTTDQAHPGVAYLLVRPRTLVAGTINALPLAADLTFAKHRLTPSALRAEIAKRGWQRIAGFQTRNPIHRAHEHLTKLALEFTDGLVIHPLVGETKQDDVPATVRFQAYEVLVDRYYPRDRTLLAAFPAAMRYAGPREALFHAIARKNYGITHLIVGRDHAGVGKFYGPYEAQEMFDKYTIDEIGVAPIKLEPTFFCTVCDTTASTRTCPHDPSERVELSGTKVRELLRKGEPLPSKFSRPEVAEILRAHYLSVSDDGSPAPAAAKPAGGAASAPAAASAAAKPAGSPAAQAGPATSAASAAAKPAASVSSALTLGEDTRKGGVILWFTGLSGAGKSTVAQAVRQRLKGHPVEILDGDEVRENLSKGLGFTKADRDTNIRRIGFVARLLARHGVIVITAAISPYEDTRDEVRRQAEAEGTRFIEIYAKAEMNVLVERDVKGLYKKALAGEIAHFTGVSDPYEPPRNPEIVVRSDHESIDTSASRVLAYLGDHGLLSLERTEALVS
jgi:sulfate adenylyltransferase